MSLHCKQEDKGSEVNGRKHLLNLFAINIFVLAHLVFLDDTSHLCYLITDIFFN
jgi:hypothetical protein